MPRNSKTLAIDDRGAEDQWIDRRPIYNVKLTTDMAIVMFGLESSNTDASQRLNVRTIGIAQSF